MLSLVARRTTSLQIPFAIYILYIVTSRLNHINLAPLATANTRWKSSTRPLQAHQGAPQLQCTSTTDEVIAPHLKYAHAATTTRNVLLQRWSIPLPLRLDDRPRKTAQQQQHLAHPLAHLLRPAHARPVAAALAHIRIQIPPPPTALHTMVYAHHRQCTGIHDPIPRPIWHDLGRGNTHGLEEEAAASRTMGEF